MLLLLLLRMLPPEVERCAMDETFCRDEFPTAAVVTIPEDEDAEDDEEEEEEEEEGVECSF